MAESGFVGLGLMGSRIVKRLPNAGHSVSHYNRTQAKADKLIASGGQWRNTPREVAPAADVTFSMVSDTAALSSVVDGKDGMLARVAEMNGA
jgi:3-hydroxyisobutyrate dehydrogenase-like beta-hydroxyacid dehydrogenase